jgi:penicillin-binding protein 1A
VAEKLVLRSPRFVDVHAQHVAEMARRVVVERWAKRPTPKACASPPRVRAADQRAAHAALRRACWRTNASRPGAAPRTRRPCRARSSRTRRRAGAEGPARRRRPARGHRAGRQPQGSDGQAGQRRECGHQGRRAAPGAARPATQGAGPSAICAGVGHRRVQALPTGAKGRKARNGPSCSGRRPRPPSWRWTRPPAACARWWAALTSTASSSTTSPQAGASRAAASSPSCTRPRLEHGVMPETLVDDAPLLDADGGVPELEPAELRRQVRRRSACAKAWCAPRTWSACGCCSTSGWAQRATGIGRFGFDMAQAAAGPDLALGTGSVTPLQLASAYAVLANGGHRVAPVLIERIVDAQGQVLFEAPPRPPLTPPHGWCRRATPSWSTPCSADVTLRGTAARAKATLQRPTCTARPAPPTTRWTPGLPASPGRGGGGLDGLRRTAQPGRTRIRRRPGAADLDRQHGKHAQGRPRAPAPARREGGRAPQHLRHKKHVPWCFHPWRLACVQNF